MNVLSLFDGMSCGRIALDRLGIPVTNYYASEIDKYAIQVSKANWPDIVHVGDVTKLYGGYFSPPIDLLIGGSPCQGFSFAGKQLNFEDPRSKLFFDYVRILKEIRVTNPNVFFFLENVMMKQEYQDVISGLLGVKPIKHNSALVSAQNRKRLYWTNIPFMGQPADRGIVLKDILENGCDTVLRWQNSNSGAIHDNNKGATLRSSGGADIRKRMQVVEQTGVIKNKNKYEVRNDKAMCLDANYHKGGDNHGQRTLIAEELYLSKTEIERGIFQAQGKTWKSGNKMGNMDFPNNPEKKAKTLCTVNTKGGRETNHVLELAGLSEYSPRCRAQNGFIYRKLTCVECERLQCVPDNYTNHVSNTQRYKMLGNGWCVESIMLFFEPLKCFDLL